MNKVRLMLRSNGIVVSPMRYRGMETSLLQLESGGVIKLLVLLYYMIGTH